MSFPLPEPPSPPPPNVQPVAPPVMPTRRRSRRATYGILFGAVVVAASLLVGGAWYLGLLGGGSGALNIYVHDAPCVCSHVYVTFTAVQVHKANGTTLGSGGWFTLSLAGGTFDLLRLNGSALAALLASAKVPAGLYTMIELTVQNVTVDPTVGPSIAANVVNPTAHIEGPFPVSADGTTTLTLEVNLGASLHIAANGSAVFTPNIGMVVGGP